MLGGAIVLLVHGFYAAKVSEQVSRNDFLKKETEKLDKDIAEIKKLKDEIAALLSRKQVIETLQADRAQTVYLLDQLVRQLPDGVYLRSITQKGLRMMRNVEASQWIGAPKLNEIKATMVGNKRVSEFNLDLSLKRAQTNSDAAGKAPAAPAPAAAAKKG